MKTKTAVRTTTKTRTAVALITGGVILAAAVASFGPIQARRVQLQRAITAFPYQTQGYVPGYVPGYIPGYVPGYSVPGYVPGYGTFIRLTPRQFLVERQEWIKRWESKFRVFK